MQTFRRLFGIVCLLALVLVASCSGGTAPPSGNSGQATAPTAAPTAASAATATAAPKATAAPTQGAAPSATTQATAPTAAPAATQAKPTTAPVAKPASKSGTFGKAELDQIFPPGRGQDLVFRACVNCHNWVPIVMAGFDTAAWQQNKINHRNRVSGLSDEEFDYLYDYLAKTFPAGHPVPDNIPEDLLTQWTSY